MTDENSVLRSKIQLKVKLRLQNIDIGTPASSICYNDKIFRQIKDKFATY